MDRDDVSWDRDGERWQSAAGSSSHCSGQGRASTLRRWERRSDAVATRWLHAWAIYTMFHFRVTDLWHAVYCIMCYYFNNLAVCLILMCRIMCVLLNTATHLWHACNTDILHVLRTGSWDQNSFFKFLPSQWGGSISGLYVPRQRSLRGF